MANKDSTASTQNAEMSEIDLDQVSGGLNPQPLPPFTGDAGIIADVYMHNPRGS